MIRPARRVRPCALGAVLLAAATTVAVVAGVLTRAALALAVLADSALVTEIEDPLA